MMPNMNPRMMKQAMKRMGIQQEEIEAVEVIIRTAEKEIVIADPQVSKVNMMGQETWQIMGTAEERSLDTTPDINEEDVKTVMDQASVSEEKAREALEETKGDLAEAIMKLQG
ncbi:nascent polypeptide-associated complex protein [Candidatus Woesearchaeota archaeon CG11_big_fil_rev_8_21_14_0_20_43_8]|nr:MAG: nascent polypeptide-associated complex protein [Candidatus Woesearchaeota archaeon CG11_big_fil_rev_8_21_14_0_20_43_8]PIO04943.1 MAG: nascent polypeptide-associated complex protein [Candidatus Woesearchaeota archaeon CG08_land_8_20_14_0_20_43_7]